MSILSKVFQQVRSLLRNDREGAILRRSQGVHSGVGPDGSGMLQSYGQDSVRDFLRQEYDLLARYLDCERMDEYPEISSALDVYADDATLPHMPSGRVIWVESHDKDLEDLLNDFLHRQIRIGEQLWQMARCVCTYGNYYGELTVAEEGVVQVRDLAPATMRRVEGSRGELWGFVQDFHRRVGITPEEFQQLMQTHRANSAPTQGTHDRTGALNRSIPFESWQVVHFRVTTKSYRSVYGYAVTDPARWAWKRLTLLEDSALLYRLQRSPERFAFYVDVGRKPEHEARQALQWAKRQLKKKKYVNPKTNELDLKMDALSPDEDFFIPVMNGKETTRVERLSGPAWQCLVGATEIPLLDGTSQTLKEMSDRGGEFDVYACTAEGRVVPGKAYAPRMTFESAQIWEVELDSGEVVRCTHNHPFLTRDGEWVLAEDLVHGSRLMSLGDPRSVRSVVCTEVFEPVYDLTVEDHHCFAVGQGVFVHNSMEDVNYFRSKMFAALKVPKAYMGDEEGVNRSVLSSEDVRFARTILRVQRELRSGVEKICRTHLAALGIPPDRLEFSLKMTVPSQIFELAQMEVRAARADLASRMREQVSHRWVLENIFGLSDGAIVDVFKERSEDYEREAVDQANAQAAADKAAPGSEGGGMFASTRPSCGQSQLVASYKERPGLIGSRGGVTDKGRSAKPVESVASKGPRLGALHKQLNSNSRQLKSLQHLLREVAEATRAPRRA